MTSIFPPYIVSEYHLKERENYFECLQILDKLISNDIVDMILEFHIYNSIIHEIYFHIDFIYYKIIIDPIYHKRLYNIIYIYLLDFFPLELIDMILTFHDYNICLTYENLIKPFPNYQCVYI